MKAEEQKIILQLKQGDNNAYKYIYDKYYILLCSIAYEYLKDDFLAATIVNDLIFGFWEKRDSIEISTSLKSYLVRAVRNRSVNHLNLEREKREIAFSLTPDNDAILVSYTNIYDYPLGKLLEDELEEKITNAIENLPSDCRAVFKMSRYEELKYSDIASRLGISVNTVKYHMKNALQLLNNELSKYLILCLIFLQ